MCHLQQLFHRWAYPKGYFSEEELEEIGDEDCALEAAAAGVFRPDRESGCRGVSYIVLQLPASQVERFASGNGVEAGQIQGMYLNIRYEDGALYCITGLSLGFFTLDKTLEDLWDRSAEEFCASGESPACGNSIP